MIATMSTQANGSTVITVRRLSRVNRTPACQPITA